MEIYIPALHKTCELEEDLPDSYRWRATMCGGLLCGGYKVRGLPASHYCLRLEGKIFSKTSVERSFPNIRPGFSCWDQGERGVLIMGDNNFYGKGDNRTTDLVSADGLTSSPSFPLKYKIR